MERRRDIVVFAKTDSRALGTIMDVMRQSNVPYYFLKEKTDGMKINYASSQQVGKYNQPNKLLNNENPTELIVHKVNGRGNKHPICLTFPM